MWADAMPCETGLPTGSSTGRDMDRPTTARPALRNVSNFEKGGTPSGMLPPVASNMRVTRLAAARLRQAELQQEQQSKMGRPVLTCAPPAWEDAMSVDAEGADGEEPVPDAQQCAHIVSDIFQYLRCRELRHRVQPNFLQGQHDINSNMRGILVDWLVEVGEEYKLQHETLHLCVNYIDRFLSHVPVARSKLQLVGVGCLLVASKYEDVSPPTVEDLVYISDNTYSREEILKMEGAVLSRLQFDLSVVTAVAFLPRYTRGALAAGACVAKLGALCAYLVELTLQDYSFVQHRASMVAASAVRLALHTLGLPAWSAQLERETGYTAAELAICVAEMRALFAAAAASSLQAVRDKYSHPSFFCVATLTAPSSGPP